MSFQSFVTERLAIITAQLNAIGTNAKKIDELPVQSNLDPASKIHVSRGGNSESLEVQEIINSINNNTYNQLLSIGEITLVDNVVTIPANARAQISQINYNTVAITTIPIPYAAAGLTRTDILVFNTSSLIVRVPGNETAGIAVRPNIPINTVLVTEINVTELAIGDPTPPVTLEALATKLDKDGYTGTAQILDDRITVLEGSDTNSPVYNNIRKSTGFSLVAQNLTINALWEWDILNVNYSNTLAVNKTIPYCVSGLKRIDYVVPNKFDSFDIISGEETSGILVAPSLPNNGIYVTYFIVTDSEVGEASIPIIGENYITKASKSFIRMFYTGDVDVVSIDDKSYLKFEQGMTSLKSINIPDSKNFYFGKSYIIKNGTTNNVTLHHQSGAGTFKFNFPNAQNLVLKPEESINIVLRAINYTNTGGLLDYVGISSGPIAITDVTGLASELDSKLDAADYNNHYKGVYLTEAALFSAHPTASVGDYAQVNEVGATDVVNYNWDGEENIWVKNSTQSTPISNTDALPEGTSNLYFQTARVLATLLNGVSFVTGGSIVSTDSVLVAFGKIQKQISDNLTAIGTKQNTLVSGTNIKTINSTSLLGSGDIVIAGGAGEITPMNATSFEAYGDSITVGQNSSPTTNSYINLLAGLYSKTVVNRAVGARGIWEATKNHLLNINPTHTVLAIVMAGFNDVKRGGSSLKTKAKILNGYKSILANHFLKSFIAAGTTSASIVRSGSWTNTYTGLSVGAKTNTGSFSSINGNYIDYTFTDNNVVIGLVGSDGVTYTHADFTVLIDGISQGNYTTNNQMDGISDDSNDNKRGAMCLVFGGLSDGTHTVRVQSTSAGYFIIDYFGHLKHPKFCTPILLMEAPHMDAIGYAQAPYIATPEIMNQLNADINALVATFLVGYPIVVAKTNDYYNVTTGIDVDHVHPNNVGHRQIYTAAYNALDPLLLVGAVASVVIVDATTTVKGIVKLAGDLAGTADLPTVPALLNKLNINANASLAGTGTRMMEASSDGTPIATYGKYQMKVTDSDIITAVTSATYTSGEATIIPANSKIMYEGQVYKTGTYLYRAYSDNVILRLSIL